MTQKLPEKMPHTFASPACALGELSAAGADPAYMGWLGPEAVQSALAGLLRLAPDDARRQALQALCPDLHVQAAPDTAAFHEMLGNLLPQVQDDSLHAALKQLRP